jgi:hypothetical protein
MLEAQTFSFGSISGFSRFCEDIGSSLELVASFRLPTLHQHTMTGATATVTREIEFRLPLTFVYAGQATVTFLVSRALRNPNSSMLGLIIFRIVLFALCTSPNY